MKKILFFIIMMLAILPQAPAAFTPDAATGALQINSTAHYAASGPGIIVPSLKKPTRLQQLALKLTQRKWFQKWMKAADNQRTKDTLAIIALVAGVLLVVSLFAFPPAGIVLAPTAIVTGIMGVSKNPNRRSYIYALIGLILGLTYVLLLLILLALVVAWFGGW